MATLAPSSSDWLDGLPSAGDLGVSHNVRPDTGDSLDAVRSGVASWRSMVAPGCSILDGVHVLTAQSLRVSWDPSADPWTVCPDLAHLGHVDRLTSGDQQLRMLFDPPQLCQVATVEDVVQVREKSSLRRAGSIASNIIL